MLYIHIAQPCVQTSQLRAYNIFSPVCTVSSPKAENAVTNLFFPHTGQYVHSGLLKRTWDSKQQCAGIICDRQHSGIDRAYYIYMYVLEY